jgi:hypothetical protein
MALEYPGGVMRTPVSVFVLSACVLAGAVTMSAQQQPAPPPGQGGGARAGGPGGPQAPMDLKVLPNTWSRQQVGALMQTFTKSLGVMCNHCHAEDPDAPPPPPGRGPTLKYSLDTKPEKDIARKMIKMTMDLNENALKGIDPDAGPEKVSCFTCHQGQQKPAFIPSDGWGRGNFSLLPAGPTVPARGAGGAPPAPPAAPPAGN